MRVQVEEHPVYKRKGADLFMEKTITLVEALTGFNFEILTLDKKKVIVSTSPGEIISPNSIKTVKGYGMPFFKDSFSKGNLLI